MSAQSENTGIKKVRKKMYARCIQAVFEKKYTDGAKIVDFTRAELKALAVELKLDPSNDGDIVYTYRYRRSLPDSIRDKAPSGQVWIIRGRGDGLYRFVAVPREYAYITPYPGMSETKIPDATPGVIAKYAQSDEQALLAKIRYNRLLDIFSGIASYSLQSHLRTKVAEIGQVETDEIYVGIDKAGVHYVLPVQAKGKGDRHSIVQIEQDYAMCRVKFPGCICRPIAAQFLPDKTISLFSFSFNSEDEAAILDMKRYALVPPESISDEELQEYLRQAQR
jgi:hypothetical protein